MGYGVSESSKHFITPKNFESTKMVNFCPISLCSVIYKIIACMIVNRLNLVLDKCIDVSQSSFVLGRLVMDIILVL